MKKLKDRAATVIMCLIVAYIPVRLLTYYGVVEDSVQNWVIAGVIGLVLFMMAR